MTNTEQADKLVTEMYELKQEYIKLTERLDDDGLCYSDFNDIQTDLTMVEYRIVELAEELKQIANESTTADVLDYRANKSAVSLR